MSAYSSLNTGKIKGKEKWVETYGTSFIWVKHEEKQIEMVTSYDEQSCPGQHERSINGSKRIKSGCFT